MIYDLVWGKYLFKDFSMFIRCPNFFTPNSKRVALSILSSFFPSIPLCWKMLLYSGINRESNQSQESATVHSWSILFLNSRLTRLDALDAAAACCAAAAAAACWAWCCCCCCKARKNTSIGLENVSKNNSRVAYLLQKLLLVGMRNFVMVRCWLLFRNGSHNSGTTRAFIQIWSAKNGNK